MCPPPSSGWISIAGLPLSAPEDAADLIDEMIDRYGDPPKSVHTLLDVALLRAAAAKAGISDIAQRGDKLRFLIADFAVEAIAKVCACQKHRQQAEPCRRGEARPLP